MSEAKSGARRWLVWHSWLALPIWVFLLFVCVTGTVATVDKEIMWLIDPAVRAGGADGAERRPLNKVVEDVSGQIPGAVVARVTFGEPYMALKVDLYTPESNNVVAWVDPFTGTVKRVSRGLNFSDFVIALHGWLLMPWIMGTPIGWYAVTILGLPMLGAAITGIMVYKRFWQAYTRPRLRFGKGSRVFWGDLHRLAGAWSLWFIIVIAATGLWFLVRGVYYDLHVRIEVEGPDIPRREVVARKAGDPMPALDLDQALATVQAARPGTRPLVVELPEHARGTISVLSRSAFPLLTEQAWVHPYDGRLLSVRHAAVAGTAEVVSAIGASLHYGNFIGLGGKLVWTFFGVLLSSLVATGTVVWTKRTVRLSREVARCWPFSGAVLARLWYRGRFYLSALILILPAMAFPFYFTMTSEMPLGSNILPQREVGPFKVTLGEFVSGPPRPSFNHRLVKDYLLHIEAGYPDRIRSVYLRQGKPPNDRNLGEVLEGDPYRLYAPVQFSRILTRSDSLWLTLEEWDGTLHQTSWPLPEVVTGAAFKE